MSVFIENTVFKQYFQLNTMFRNDIPINEDTNI